MQRMLTTPIKKDQSPVPAMAPLLAETHCMDALCDGAAANIRISLKTLARGKGIEPCVGYNFQSAGPSGVVLVSGELRCHYECRCVRISSHWSGAIRLLVNSTLGREESAARMTSRWRQ